MSRFAGIAIAALFLVTSLPTAQAATSLELTIDGASASPQDPFMKFDTALEAYDFDGDGRMEIIGHNENRHIYVFNSSDGRIVADLTTQYPPGWGARPINAPEVAVFEQGGKPHIVIANSAASIALYRYDDGTTFTKAWERRMIECFAQPGMDAQPVVYDIDGDGRQEILVQTEEVGVYALRMDGSTMWKQCIGGGNGEPAVADMDFDGIADVIFASDDGVVTRINGAGGWTVWTFRGGAAEWGLGAASMPVGPTIGQIDGKGQLDVAVGARDTHNQSSPHSNRAALFAINGDDGKALWMRQHPQGTPLTYTHPIIHDVDKDGETDVLWADWNTVGHKPPWPGDATQAWAVSGTPAVYRYDSTGDLRYRREIGSYWSNNDLALADVDADGWQELIVDNGGTMITIDSRTGATESTVGLNGWTPTRGPTVYPIHGDGTMQWLLPVHKGTSTGGIMLFDTKVPYNAAWPHVPSGMPGPGSPPPNGTFAATFTVPSTTNNWWQEVAIESSTTVTSVSAVINGGPTPMSKSNWGTWTTSVFVADGSTVVFKARDAQNREASSSTYIWGKGGAPPPSTGFNATFTVPDTKNNWWVETSVNANAPLRGVNASVNGGTPQPLQKTDWGSWAKSFYVADGSSVVFKATSTSGATASSQPFSWGKAPPPGGGPFQANFTVSDTKNNWWIESKVAANAPVESVSVSVNGAPDKALSKTDWGSWAKSFYVADGSSVVFKATSTSGATASSQSFAWGQTNPPDSGPFQATFTAPDPSNNWWVEVNVKANRPVQSVTATVNGGAPQSLPKTDWGSWAKSFHVPDGASVQFTASDGQTTVTSQAVVWT